MVEQLSTLKMMQCLAAKLVVQPVSVVEAAAKAAVIVGLADAVMVLATVGTEPVAYVAFQTSTTALPETSPLRYHPVMVQA